MKIFIPAISDGNDAPNAFALGIHSLIKRGSINIHKLSFLLNRVNYYESLSYTRAQIQLSSALRQLVVDLLDKNQNAQQLLYTAFENAFFIYCANKLGIVVSEINNYININNIYTFNKLMLIQQEAETF